MTEESSFDPRRLPPIEVQEPNVTRDVELGTASPEDYSATDTAPVADATTDDLLRTLETGAAPQRRRAVLELARREPEAAVLDRLQTALREDPDAEVRQFAVEALAKLDADPAILRAALEDEDPWVRAEGIVSLKRADAAATVSTFEDALDDSHPAVRRNALISLHFVRGDAAMDDLLEGLDDPNDRVREWAVRLLARLEDSRATAAVREHLGTEPDALVKEAGAHALDSAGDDSDPWDGAGERRAGDHVFNRPPSR